MVYIMSFFALFLFADKLVAQHKFFNGTDAKLYQLEYENSSGEIALTTFYYNEEGVMYEAFWETRDGSSNSRNYYSYNDQGQMISCYREFKNRLTSYEIFLYDEQGRKIHETFIRSDGVNGTADYVYDSKGRYDKVICDHYKGWIDGIIEFKKSELPKEADIMRDGNPIGKIVFEYDKNKNLIKDTWTFNSGWQQTFIYHYK